MSSKTRKTDVRFLRSHVPLPKIVYTFKTRVVSYRDLRSPRCLASFLEGGENITNYWEQSCSKHPDQARN